MPLIVMSPWPAFCFCHPDPAGDNAGTSSPFCNPNGAPDTVLTAASDQGNADAERTTLAPGAIGTGKDRKVLASRPGCFR